LDFKENQIKVIYHAIDHNLFKVYKYPKVNCELPRKLYLE